MREIESVDLIVPTHFVPWSCFSSNVESWFKELPLRKLCFGCNNTTEDEFNPVKDFIERKEGANFIDQRGIKTLGYQIADLMKRVETEWFVYVHADAFLTPHSFLVLEAEVNNNEKAGIVESDRIQIHSDVPRPNPYIYPNYYFQKRAYSGCQLMRKKAIKSVLDKIEDDYIYRNEDLVFQNACLTNGYDYVKSFAMHLHYVTPVNLMWTPQGTFTNELDMRKITEEMQIKGLVKYCTPDDITKKAWRDSFGVNFQMNHTNLFEFLDDFVAKTNPEWKQAIQDTICEMLTGVYR